MSKTREWDRDLYPEADHELTDAEIETRYGHLIEAFLADVLAPDLRTLAAMAKAGSRLAKRRGLI